MEPPPVTSTKIAAIDAMGLMYILLAEMEDVTTTVQIEA
jgi:hypothetical protein